MRDSAKITRVADYIHEKEHAGQRDRDEITKAARKFSASPGQGSILLLDF